jgi:uncharacterized cupin superfamily protein
MTDEAELERTEHGLVPRGEGWYVLNLGEARWGALDGSGTWCDFEGDARFPDLGLNVHVLRPGERACLYHRESVQEAFLVLQGECLLLVEEEERRLRAWDFFHCPPGTRHVFLGAGDGPCAILMVGRRGDVKITYPRSELARRHGAGVEVETDVPREAYADFPPKRHAGAEWPPR